ncbi:MAG TPA: peptidylprolyl isomerase [Fibrobacteraceae bacterium]|nr:peptidylprolyl isomerase [Fibrobacteraceae bacterium]
MKVAISYILRDDKDQVIEEIPPSHPVVYIHGLSDYVPQGLQNSLDGAKVGESRNVALRVEDAYGPYQDELLMEVPKEELRDVGQLWVGMEIEMIQDDPLNMENWKAPDHPEDLFRDDASDEPSLFIIREIREKTVVLDGNHPLAGMNLTFQVRIESVERPTVQEIEQGYPDPSDSDPESDQEWDGLDYGEGRHWR